MSAIEPIAPIPQSSIRLRAQGEIFHLHSPWARLKRYFRLDRFEPPKADLLSKDWVYDYDPMAAAQ